MNFFAMTFGQGASAAQTEIIDTLKSGGSKVIQSSNGLWIATPLDQTKLSEQLKNFNGLHLEKLDPQAVSQDPEANKDLKAFMSSAELS